MDVIEQMAKFIRGPRSPDQARIAENEASFQVAMLGRTGGREMADVITTMRQAGRTWQEILQELTKNKPE